MVAIPHGGLRTWSIGNYNIPICQKSVAIPHGGLRTSNRHINQNKTYQPFCQGGTLFE